MTNFNVDWKVWSSFGKEMEIRSILFFRSHKCRKFSTWIELSCLNVHFCYIFRTHFESISSIRSILRWSQMMLNYLLLGVIMKFCKKHRWSLTHKRIPNTKYHIHPQPALVQQSTKKRAKKCNVHQIFSIFHSPAQFEIDSMHCSVGS